MSVVQFPEELAAIRRRWLGAKRATALGVFVAVCAESEDDGLARPEAIASFSGLRLPTARRYLDDLAEIGLVTIRRGCCYPTPRVR